MFGVVCKIDFQKYFGNLYEIVLNYHHFER
jgi:hypothetical protein